MRALVQRVERAEVSVRDELVGRIEDGLLVLVGVTHSDGPREAERLAEKVYRLRVFPDDTALADRPGSAVLAVSQFTLYADTSKGRRPSWSAAAAGAQAEPLVREFVAQLRARSVAVAEGRFGAHMRVGLINDGPVTLLLEV
ncbi:MAG: D-tyrosyl-tRNA(Tyr) deacylase [Actinobacteria bacterium]|nr:D-tyrosyl-tRNA(Tyr) deacylase [Actinomycetota bacterium]